MDLLIHQSIVPWSGTDPDAKMNSFTWSTNDNDYIILGDQYNEEFNNWKGPIHNGQFRQKNLKEMIKTEKTCSKYAGSVKFNKILRERDPAIPIKSYKDQCREHMIRNGMWVVFYITDPQNKDKEWDLLLHQYIFTLEYMKGHVHSPLKGSEADQYIVQNLTWSGVYLMSTLPNYLLQKVLTLVPLTLTGPDVYVATMTNIISDSYYSLVDTLNRMKNLKLKNHPGGGCCRLL